MHTHAPPSLLGFTAAKLVRTVSRPDSSARTGAGLISARRTRSNFSPSVDQGTYASKHYPARCARCANLFPQLCWPTVTRPALGACSSYLCISLVCEDSLCASSPCCGPRRGNARMFSHAGSLFHPFHDFRLTFVMSLSVMSALRCAVRRLMPRLV